MDDNWKKLFDLTGVTDIQNQATNVTMDLLFWLVEKNGGIENVTREIEIEMKKKNGPSS